MNVDFSLAPPPETLEWASQHLGWDVAGITHLPGATTAAIHRLDGPAGTAAVIKRFTWEAFLAEEPERARHEAEALLAVDGTAVPAPSLIAYDETGADTDVPAVLTSHVRGTVAVDIEPEALAAVAAAINRVDPGRIKWRYEPYFEGNDLFVPSWSRHPDAWARLLDVTAEVATEGDHFVHRDFHPWNVLALNGQVTGVVDWLSAGRGPWQIDVAHCRGNLVLLDRVDAAERYRVEYELLTGRSYSPEWDAMMLVDAMPYYDGRREVDAWHGHDVVQPLIGDRDQRALFDAFAARTAAELG